MSESRISVLRNPNPLPILSNLSKGKTSAQNVKYSADFGHLKVFTQQFTFVFVLGFLLKVSSSKF